ncbi:hypothetical protein E2542_SST08611 [Spatholobus suberectus]|nr:hypothetical protein E2542_SST08611 [Spatholobus suberectus]
MDEGDEYAAHEVVSLDLQSSNPRELFLTGPTKEPSHRDADDAPTRAPTVMRIEDASLGHGDEKVIVCGRNGDVVTAWLQICDDAPLSQRSAMEPWAETMKWIRDGTTVTSDLVRGKQG